MQDLEIPLLEKPEEAIEMIRFWIDGDQDSVMLKVGVMGDGEPEQWGMILADVARHAVRGMQQYYPELSEEDLHKRIRDGFLRRMQAKDLTAGSLTGDVQ